VLVEKPALRNAVRSGSEGHPVDAGLNLAFVFEGLTDPAGMQKMVTVA
jgi:hypothetical protein